MAAKESEEDGQKPLADATELDAGESRPSRNRKLTERGKSYKLEQYYSTFRKLKTLGSQIKTLMFENKSDTEDVRKQYSAWLNTYERFLNHFDELATQIDERENNEMSADHYDYDIFLINFKKEVEDYFSRMEETKSKIIKVKSHTTSFTSNASNISSQRIKEETKLAELEARKSVLKRKKQLEMAKLQLKLDEEELDIDTGIAVSHAKSEVLQKYENIPEEQSLNRFDFIENKEDSVGCPRQLIPKPSPRTPKFQQEIGSQISCSLDPNANAFVPRSHSTDKETKQQDALQDVVNYLRRP